MSGIPRITPQQRQDFLLESYLGSFAIPEPKTAYRQNFSPYGVKFHIFPTVPDLGWCKDFVANVLPAQVNRQAVKIEFIFEDPQGSGMWSGGPVALVQGVGGPENTVRVHLGQVIVDLKYDIDPENALVALRRSFEGKNIL